VQQTRATVIDVAEESHAIEGNSRRTMHAGHDELQEYPVSYGAKTCAFFEEAFTVVHASACVSVAMRWMNREERIGLRRNF